MKKITLKNEPLINKKIVDECPKCGVRCCNTSTLHPSPMLECPKCGQLIDNPNYDISFVGYH